MVKFEFTVSDVDAENISNILFSAYLDAQEEYFNLLDKGDGSAEWFKRHAEYVKKLHETVSAGSSR